MQLKLHKPTMAIGYSLRMCAQNVDSTNPGRSNLVFRSKPIAEAEMSNRLIMTFIAMMIYDDDIDLHHRSTPSISINIDNIYHRYNNIYDLHIHPVRLRLSW